MLMLESELSTYLASERKQQAYHFYKLTSLSTQLHYSTTMNTYSNEFHLSAHLHAIITESTHNRKLTWWLLSAGSFTIF